MVAIAPGLVRAQNSQGSLSSASPTEQPSQPSLPSDQSEACPDRKALDDRELAVLEREARLEQLRHGFNQLEIDMSAKLTDLQTREHSAGIKEAALKGAEEEIAARQQELAAKQTKVDACLRYLQSDTPADDDRRVCEVSEADRICGKHDNKTSSVVAELQGALENARQHAASVDSQVFAMRADAERVVNTERLREAVLFAVAVHNHGILALRTVGDVESILIGKNDPKRSVAQRQEYAQLFLQALANAKRDDDLAGMYLDGYVALVKDLASGSPHQFDDVQATVQTDMARRGWQDLLSELAQVARHVRDAQRAAGDVDDNLRRRWLNELAPALGQSRQLLQKYAELKGR